MLPNIKMGHYIKQRRKALGLTQQQLADQLNISFQAVSKWETGDSFPDVSLLLALAEQLETTTDKLLNGGTLVIKPNQTLHVSRLIEGLESLENLKALFGANSIIYQGAMEGIQNRLSIDLEKSLSDPDEKEVLLTELIIQAILSGSRVDRSDIMMYVKNPALQNLILRYLGESTDTKVIDETDRPALFKQIHALNPAFKEVRRLNEMPGEFITLEPKKTYWATEVVVEKNQCYGIAVDETSIHVFEYGAHGVNHRKIQEVLIKS